MGILLIAANDLSGAHDSKMHCLHVQSGHQVRLQNQSLAIIAAGDLSQGFALAADPIEEGNQSLPLVLAHGAVHMALCGLKFEHRSQVCVHGAAVGAAASDAVVQRRPDAVGSCLGEQRAVPLTCVDAVLGDAALPDQPQEAVAGCGAARRARGWYSPALGQTLRRSSRLLGVPDLALPAVRRDALRLASLIAGEATNDVDHTYVVKPSKGGWIIRSGGQDLKFDDAFKNSAEAVARASMIAYNNLSATGSTSRVVVAPVGAPPQTVAVFRAAPVSATSLS